MKDECLLTGKTEKKTGNKAKANSTSFQKGISGNPSGRPRKTDEQKLADSEADTALNMLKQGLPNATAKVMALLDDPETPPNVKVRILELMLDRTYGKAFQAVQVEADVSEVGIALMPMRGDHD